MFFACAPVSLQAQTQNIVLEDFLQNVIKNSEDVRALDLEMQSLKLEIEARDLELSPTFAVDFNHFWDDRPSLSSNYQIKGESTAVTLSKPFATGTSLSLTSSVENAKYRTTPLDDQNLLNWQLGIKQSLWQNSFGRQTSLRRTRDQHELQSRLLTLMLKRQQVLVDFELLYWDIVYAQQAVKITQQNFERSERIFTWIEDRFKRFAAQRVDYLQAQTLVASRDLQRQTANDNLKILQAGLKEKLSVNEVFSFSVEDLQKERDVLSLSVLADFAPQTPVLIESLQAQAQADFFKAKSQLQADELKPVLDVGYSYGQQGLSSSFSDARDQAFSTSNDYHKVEIIFSWPLDFALITKSRLSTELLAKAQDLRSLRSKRQSKISWEDLQRTLVDQKQRVETAQDLAKLQNEKSKEEQSLYEKGKSTAFEAISFEQDAAESELLALQLLTGFRKAQTQARFYVHQSDFLQ